MNAPGEPLIVVIPAGPVVLGEPPFPEGSVLPHPWPRHHVHVPIFGIAKFAVTVEEYMEFSKGSGYSISDDLLRDPRFGNPKAPAAFVSWIDATRYAQWLARSTGKPFRLVRDAEYEKAARGGIEGKRFPWGDQSPTGHADLANPDGAPLPVGSFAPNGYGLHDLAGSMWCWCEECYDQVSPGDAARMCYDDTLIKDVRMNPICRGGSFKTRDPVALYSAYRHEDPTDGRFDCIGFRVALTLS